MNAMHLQKASVPVGGQRAWRAPSRPAENVRRQAVIPAREEDQVGAPAVRALSSTEVLAKMRARRLAEETRFGVRAHDVLYTPTQREVDGELVVIEGGVPADFPVGAYVRNGPNCAFFEQRGEDHIFDADGMLHAAVFPADGCPQYINRYVQTESHKQEAAAGTKLFGGVMSRSGLTMVGSLLGNTFRLGKTFKDTANTGVVWFAGRLLALMEASPPFQIKLSAAEKLATVPGYFDFDGQLDHPMTAHPKICPKTGEAMMFGYMAEGKPYMKYSVFGPDGKKTVSQAIDLDKPVMTHDMAITENYSVLLDLPLVFDIGNLIKNKFVFGYDSTHPARIGILPRRGGPVEWFPVSTCNVFHTVNAYEDEKTGEVVLHGCRYECDRDPYFEYNPAYMYEWRFTPGSGGRGAVERLLDTRPVEYPKINNDFMGQKYKYAYVVEGTSLGGMTAWTAPSEGLAFSNMLKYDMDQGKVVDAWESDDGKMYGELEFVPRVGSNHKPGAADCSPEDDGYLVTYGTDVKEGYSFVVIMDAANLSKGPVALLKTPQLVPAGLHGTWVPAEGL